MHRLILLVILICSFTVLVGQTSSLYKKDLGCYTFEMFDSNLFTFRVSPTDSNSVSLHFVDELNLDSETIVIPSKVTCNSKTYTVKYTDIDALSFKREVILPNTIEKIGIDPRKEYKLLVYCINSSEIKHLYSYEKPFKLTLPKSVSYINHNLLSYGSLNEFSVDSANPFFCSIDGVLYNRDTTKLICFPNRKKKAPIFPIKLRNIGAHAFKGNRYLSKITLPNSIDSIGDRAFCSCDNLRKVNIPNSVRYFGEGVFYNSKSIKSIELPNSINGISSRLFSDCSSLSKVELPKNIKIISSCAFENCTNLKKIVLPDSLRVIDSQAFRYCKNLKQIIIPDSLIFIGESAFSDCDKLDYIQLPKRFVDIPKEWYSLARMKHRSIYGKGIDRAVVFLSSSPPKNERKLISEWYKDLIYVPKGCDKQYVEYYKTNYEIDKANRIRVIGEK